MKPHTVSTLRRVSQIAFFAAFLVLLLRTGSGETFLQTSGPRRLPPALAIFLQADPLHAIVTALSTWTLYRGLLWCLVILLPTFVIGRFFCGWICPLGSLNHFMSALKSEKKHGARLIASNRYKSWHAVKYYVLAAGLVAALFGSAWVGLLDPISLAVRSLTVSVVPALDYALNGVLNAVYRLDAHPVRAGVDALDGLLEGTVLGLRQPHFRQSLLIGLVLLSILAANLWVTRFWCRSLCPLGALLGLTARWSIFGLDRQATKCDECNRCLMHCQGGDDPIPTAKWRKPECHLCMNCVEDCPTGGLAFRFFPGRSTTMEAPELKRRKLITGLATGAAVVPLLRSTADFAVDADPRLIRPPGALDESEFLARCIRCGECMKVCPNNALQPALTQGGFEALWTPVLVPRVGYCEPNCVLCGEVCPTGAIWEITEAEKLGGAAGSGAAPVKIGTAFYDRGRCLPWAMATECIVCEEWCPASPKAITLQSVDVVDSQGMTVRVRQPSLDPQRCTGCGACEYACPVHDQPAIYVTAIGETRSRSNQFILPRDRPQA